jgi:hypothetical protein
MQHFAALLEHCGVEKAGSTPVVDIDAARVQFDRFKFFMLGKNTSVVEGGFICADGTPQRIETFMRENHHTLASGFPDLWKLMQIAVLVPMTSVPCERGFSKMRHIKTKGRSLLGDNTLDCLMRISSSSHGPNALSVGDFRKKYAQKVASAWKVERSAWKAFKESSVAEIAEYIEEASKQEEEEEAYQEEENEFE